VRISTQETEIAAKFSEVMRKNSNLTPSKLMQERNVVEGYTSTCDRANFVTGKIQPGIGLKPHLGMQKM
jgi:hypothetical protein